MKSRYIGITIGPLGATLSLAGSPAGLWAASYLFSYLADTLCRLLVAGGVPSAAFVVPYYDPADPLMQAHREAGLYHDRIIFRADRFPIEAVADIRRRAVAETARAFSLDEEYLSRYLLIEAATFEAENPVAESEAILNSLELAPPFVAQQEENPLITLFTTNRLLRATPLMQSMGSWELLRADGGYKSLGELVAVGETEARYYALVRGDGDVTGRLLRTLKSDEEIRAFSRACLSYCADIAALTREYGGFTVYAGGDDLLVMLPCVDEKERPLPAFLQAASRLYAEVFSQYSADASISFGVVIGRVNTPLHEMLDAASHLLFRQAKRTHNTVALHLTGRRNGASSLLVPMETLPTLLTLLQAEATRRQLYTAVSTLRWYMPLFDAATTLPELHILVKRFMEFDYGHSPFIRKGLPELLYALKQGLPLYAVKGTQPAGVVETACYLLDLVAFFVEGGYRQ